MKIHVASSRLEDIGTICRRMAEELIRQYDNPRTCYVTDPYKCDIFISVLYDQILTPEFIRTRRMCFNFHPGLLPEYRGSGAFTWALMNKEKETGITLHQINDGIDTGPIIRQWVYPIQPEDTAHSLFLKGMAIIRGNFKEVFWDLIRDNFGPPTIPNLEGKLYTRKDLKNALDITHMVRAFHFPGKPGLFYTKRNGEVVNLEW